MATVSTAVNETVKDIKSDLSLVDDTNYLLQYRGGGELRIQSGSSAPAVTSGVYFRLYDGDAAIVNSPSGENVYGWTDGGIGVVILDSVS